jgi:polysaccharide pyruvyl transferase WcaK-like protein
MEKNNIKKIIVLGWYNHQNIGDESYKIAFPLLFPNIDFTFTDKLPPIVDADAIILGGGDILYTDFSKQLIAHPTIPKYAFSVSVREGMDLPPVTFKRIVSRDSVPNCEWLPDFTFVLKPNATHGKALINRIFDSQKKHYYEKICAVVINANLMVGHSTLARNAATFEKFAFDLSRLMDETPASFLLMPFGNGFPHNDRITNSVIYSRCKFWEKNAIVYEQYSPQDTLDILSAVDVTISSRLHSSVFSCIGGTPFIDITHHDKNRVFLQTIGKVAWSVNYWQFSLEQCKKLLEEFLFVNPHKQELLALADVYKNLLKTTAPSLLV